MRVGVIGAGLMGTTHVRLLSGEVAGAEVVAISDAVLPAAERLAASAGVNTVYVDACELIADPAVEGVVIASPAVTHEAFVLACLDAGKPVLCEKPLAVDAAACLRVLEAEATLGRRLIQVGFMRRFDPAYVELKHRTEAIGAPVLAHCAHRNPAVPPSFDTEMTLTDSLVHDVDAARWLLGEEFSEVTVLAPRTTPHAPEGVLDPLIVLLRTGSGLHVDVECFVNARYGYDIRCEIVGADAAAALPPDCAAGFQDRFATAYVRELESWAAGAGSGAGAWDGYAASVVCEAAVQSLRSGRPAAIRLPRHATV
jgi:myo-inositol 2-dehydrogenase/D-chiro-inositol 1-dehydrogenase